MYHTKNAETSLVSEFFQKRHQDIAYVLMPYFSICFCGCRKRDTLFVYEDNATVGQMASSSKRTGVCFMAALPISR